LTPRPKGPGAKLLSSACLFGKPARLKIFRQSRTANAPFTNRSTPCCLNPRNRSMRRPIPARSRPISKARATARPCGNCRSSPAKARSLSSSCRRKARANRKRSARSTAPRSAVPTRPPCPPWPPASQPRSSPRSPIKWPRCRHRRTRRSSRLLWRTLQRSSLRCRS